MAVQSNCAFSAHCPETSLFVLQIFCFPNEPQPGCANSILLLLHYTTSDLTGLSDEQDPTNLYNKMKAAGRVKYSFCCGQDRI